MGPDITGQKQSGDQTNNQNLNTNSMQPSAANPQTPPASPANSAYSAPSSSGKNKKKLAVIIIAVILVLLGGSAAAYYGTVAPNKPENVLKSSVANLLKSDVMSGKGNASFKGKEGPAVTAAYSLQSTQTAAGGTVDVSVSGVKVPLEFRMFQKSAYVKFGDLSTVQSLAAGFGGPEAAGVVKELAGKVSGKWIEFDESLLKSALSDKCDLTKTLSDQDVDKLISFYDKNRFANIKNTSEEVVEGKKVTKLDLGFDKAKAEAFGKELESLDSLKNLKQCGETPEQASDSKPEDFKGDVSFSIWVDKGKKEIVKLAVKANSEKEGTIEADFVFNKDKVDIQKPEGAVPALQLLGELGPLLGGFGLPASTNTGSSTPGSSVDSACAAELGATGGDISKLSAKCARELGL